MAQEEIPVYSSKEEAKKVETARIRANYDLIKSGRKDVGIRDGVHTKLKIGNSVYSTTNATKTAKSTNKNKLIGLSKEKVKTEGYFNLTDTEKRTYGSTGMIRGEFSRGDVIRWARKIPGLEKTGKLPEGKSIKGFVKSMNKAYRDVGTDIALRVSQTGGVGFVVKGLGKGDPKEWHTGHVQSAINPDGLYQDAGANTRRNLASQAARGADITDTGVPVGDRSQYANIPLGNQMPKDEGALKSVGLGGNVAEAFGAYLMGDDDPDLKQWAQFGNQEDRVKGRAAFEMGTGPGGKDLAPEAVLAEEELNLRRTQNQAELDKQSPVNPNKVQAEFRAANSPKSLLTKLKSNITGRKGVRNAASIAGQSMNPFVNIAGDVVGAAMDGMVVFSTGGKDKDALADFTLSGSQAVLSIGAGLVAMVPVPGARPGAYAMIKLGDNIGKVERLWNMTREGRQLANSPDVKAFKQGRTTPDIVRLNKKEGPISAADAKMHQSLWEQLYGISHRSMRGLLK